MRTQIEWGYICLLTVIEEFNSASARDLLDEFNTLGVVFFLDFSVVCESLVLRRTMKQLESGGVKGGGLWLVSKIFHDHILYVNNGTSIVFASCGVGINEGICA